jgi:hypothetical protein
MVGRGFSLTGEGEEMSVGLVGVGEARSGVEKRSSRTGQAKEPPGGLSQGGRVISRDRGYRKEAKKQR